MTREEELITRWIDGELGTEEEAEFNKLYKLKPDYYVKGFEYTSKGLPEATREELKIVKSYGGKMI